MYIITILPSGYINSKAVFIPRLKLLGLLQLYSKNHKKRGIATKLCNELEGHFQTSKIKVHASKSALSFFMKRGYKIIKDQEVLRHGAILKN